MDQECDEVFQRLEKKIIEKLKNEEQAKALSRVQLLRKYLSSNNHDIVDKVKEKMTQELLTKSNK